MMLTPAELCRGLLGALDASEGRRRRRARNTTADSIGMDIQRVLLEGAVHDAPDATDFERWLLERCMAEGESDGATRAMALFIWQQWQLASEAEGYREWIARGAPSDDREGRGAGKSGGDGRAADPGGWQCPRPTR
ncbi:MAG TPA: hypothetical protein VFK39_06805 [Gemmatimonadaceae bacterium]|nr:hypothetical protein [Gemmatimonadaceae bacterium]